MASSVKGALGRRWMFVVCAAAAVGPAHGEVTRMPSTLQCQFDSYASAVAEKGSPGFTAEILHDAASDDVTFSDIYLDKNRGTGYAWAEGRNVSESRPMVYASDTTWVFTEFTSRGNVYVTQVFLEGEP